MKIQKQILATLLGARNLPFLTALQRTCHRAFTIICIYSLLLANSQRKSTGKIEMGREKRATRDIKSTKVVSKLHCSTVITAAAGFHLCAEHTFPKTPITKR